MEDCYGYKQVNRKTGERRVLIVVYRDEEYDRDCFYRTIHDAQINHPNIVWKKSQKTKTEGLRDA